MNITRIGAQNTVMIIAGIILSIAIAEGILRLDSRLSFGALAIKRFETFGVQAHLYRPARYWGYELIPHASPEINSFGMRDREYSFHKPAGAYRVLLLGDSITYFGRWSEYVEEKLDHDGNYEILNSAVPGWGLYHYWMYLFHKVINITTDYLKI